MEAGKKRKGLRAHLEEIKAWVKQGYSDGWIAGALGTSPGSIQSFRSRQGIYRRTPPIGNGKGVEQSGPVRAFEGVLDHGDREGWGLWFDPSVAEDAIWKEHWSGVESVVVKIARDSIVLEPESGETPAADGEGPGTGDLLSAVSGNAGSETGTGEAEDNSPSRERGRVKWFDPEKGYGFISRPEGGDLFVHRSEVRSDPNLLEPKQEVLYEVGRSERGPVALRVSGAD